MQKTTKRLWMILIVLLLGVLAASCGEQIDSSPANNPDQPVSSEDTPVPTDEPIEGEVIRKENAIIDEVQILIMESFPVQVSVHIEGQTRDGCTTVDETWSEQVDENTFEVHIVTVRPKDALCTEALVPFEVNVHLDVNGLPAGAYTVKVYDQTVEFVLEQDNVLPE